MLILSELDKRKFQKTNFTVEMLLITTVDSRTSPIGGDRGSVESKAPTDKLLPVEDTSLWLASCSGIWDLSRCASDRAGSCRIASGRPDRPGVGGGSASFLKMKISRSPDFGHR